MDNFKNESWIIPFKKFSRIRVTMLRKEPGLTALKYLDVKADLAVNLITSQAIYGSSSVKIINQ